MGDSTLTDVPLNNATGGAYGHIAAGEAEHDALMYNAAISRQNAELARQKGIEDERRQRIVGRRFMGEQKAAAGGTGVTSDSFGDVFEDNAASAELDALNVRHASILEAMGYESQASMQKMAAKQARKQGYISASNQLMSNAKMAVGGA